MNTDLQQTLAQAIGQQRAGNLAEAQTLFRRIIARYPAIPDAYNHLGYVLHLQGRFQESADTYRKAIALLPTAGILHSNLGNVLAAQGRFDDAAAAYRAAIALSPKLAEPHNNLGNILRQQGRIDEAIDSYRTTIRLRPDFPDAFNNLATALKDQGRADEALHAARNALRLRPDFFLAHNNLGNILKDMGLLDEAIEAYRAAIAHAPHYHSAHSNLLYTLYFHPLYDGRAILREHLAWTAQHCGDIHSCSAHANSCDPDRPLRIGYVSPDFRQHPVGRFLLPLLAHHDRENYSVTCYSSVARPDAMTEQLRTQADLWVCTTGMNDEQLALRIAADHIDILVDLTLHMAGNRMALCARKPAPVQITYLAYPGTSGLGAIDWRLSDSFLDPPGMHDGHYSEATLRLAHSYWCYQPPAQTPQVAPPPALVAGFITFGSLNNFSKVTPPALQAWARILQTLPASRILIHCEPGAHRDRARKVFAEEQVDPHRVDFITTQPLPQYLATYNRIDIALDPFPYCGGTTTCDALWMGVPVVTLAGHTAVGRSGVSILSNLGRSQWIATSVEDYIQIAVNLAADVSNLAESRSTLRPQMQASILCDAPALARDLQVAYRYAWQQWCRGNSLQSR